MTRSAKSINKALDPTLAHDLVAAMQPERVKPLDDALMVCVLHGIPGNFDDAGHVLKMLKRTLGRSSLVTRKKARELVQRATRLRDEFKFDETSKEEWGRGYETTKFIIEPILAEIPTPYQCYQKIVRTEADTHIPFLVDRYFSNPFKTEDHNHNAFTQRRLIREHVVSIVAAFSLGKECFRVLEMEARQLEDEIPFELENNLELVDVIKRALGPDFSDWYQDFRGVPYDAELQALNERQQRERDRKCEELEAARKDFLAYHGKYREPPTARQAALLIQKIDEISEGLDGTKKLRYFSESNRFIDRAKQLLKPYFPDAAFRMHEVQENGPGPYARERVLDGLKAIREILEIEAAKEQPTDRLGSVGDPQEDNAEAASRGKIDVAIITIREDENRAVLNRVADRRLIRRKNRTYSVGVVDNAEGGQYTVAVLRTLEQGPNAAQDATRDAIEDLDPRLIVVAGIAGAVPDTEFTLGDVVIASRLHDFTVAAFGEGVPPRFVNQGGPMKKEVQDLVALLPALDTQLAGWNAEDRIGVLRPGVDLSEANFYGDDDWRKDTRSSLHRFFGVAGHRAAPIFTTRAIAASGSLIKSTQILEIWRQASRDVAAVEMELSGIYAAARRRDREYPVLAIRGISDIVGFKRSPEWTAYACHTAAAFCVALLTHLPSELLPPR
jgi:nucleoside phosphorylase